MPADYKPMDKKKNSGSFNFKEFYEAHKFKILVLIIMIIGLFLYKKHIDKEPISSVAMEI